MSKLKEILKNFIVLALCIILLLIALRLIYTISCGKANFVEMKMYHDSIETNDISLCEKINAKKVNYCGWGAHPEGNFPLRYQCTRIIAVQMNNELICEKLSTETYSGINDSGYQYAVEKCKELVRKENE